MDILPTALMVTGTLISAGGALQEGQAAEAGARFEAAQMSQAAGQERAASQRRALEERRRARLAQSRAQAVAAASGAGATDPTVLNIIGDIEEEGEYRALTAMFEGEEAARGMEMGAMARLWEGRQQRKASRITAASKVLEAFGGIPRGSETGGSTTTSGSTNTLLSRGGRSLLQKYG